MRIRFLRSLARRLLPLHTDIHRYDPNPNPDSGHHHLSLESLFLGSMELWGDSAVAFEPMSAKADAFNNYDHLAILSDGETFTGTFGFSASL